MAPPAPKPRFIDGEKVLCFHGPLIYEAKCLKSQIRDKQMKYFIHYNGWNKNWDEWVPDNRVLKFNEANIQKQKELSKTLMKNKRSKSIKVLVKKDGEKEPDPPEKALPEKSAKPKIDKPKVEKRISVSSSPPDEIIEHKVEVKKKKQRLEKETCFIDEVNVDIEIKIDFPQPMREWLVDDWDLVTRQDMLLNVPARVTVDHVIANYVKEKVSEKGLSQTMECTIVQFANKIRDAFNVLLGKLLLYPFERQQYADMLAEYPGWSMCQIYGAIHLLRMLTKMGPLLTSLSSPESDNSSISKYLNDFTEYMSMNNNFFSLKDYIVASPAYHRIG